MSKLKRGIVLLFLLIGSFIELDQVKVYADASRLVEVTLQQRERNEFQNTSEENQGITSSALPLSDRR